MKSHNSINIRKGNLSEYLNQKKADTILIQIGAEAISFSDKARSPTFNPPDGIPPLDEVTISGPDLPIYYTTDGSTPNENSNAIVNSPTTITMNLPATLKARGSIGGILLGDVVESFFDRLPLFEVECSEHIDISIGASNISWEEMIYIDEILEDHLHNEIGIVNTSWSEIIPIDSNFDETLGNAMSIYNISWQEVNPLDI